MRRRSRIIALHRVARPSHWSTRGWKIAAQIATHRCRIASTATARRPRNRNHMVSKSHCARRTARGGRRPRRSDATSKRARRALREWAMPARGNGREPPRRKGPRGRSLSARARAPQCERRGRNRRRETGQGDRGRAAEASAGNIVAKRPADLCHGVQATLRRLGKEAACWARRGVFFRPPEHSFRKMLWWDLQHAAYSSTHLPPLPPPCNTLPLCA